MALPVKIELIGNRILISSGQVIFAGGTAAPDGLLSSVTVVAKPEVACPDPGGTAPVEVSATFETAVLGAPDGSKYEVTALPGYFAYIPATARKVFLPWVMRHG